MPKPFKSKTLILFTILFHKNLHSYNNLFMSNKVSQTPTYILLKQKKKKKLIYTHHMTPPGSTYESTWTLKLKWQRVFTWQRP